MRMKEFLNFCTISINVCSSSEVLSSRPMSSLCWVGRTFFMIYLYLALRYKAVLIIPFVPMRSAKKQIICVKYCFSYTVVQFRRWFYDLSDTLKTDRSGRTTSLYSFILACDPLTLKLSSIILFYCCRFLSKPEQKILHFHNSLRLAGWLRVIIPDFKGIPTNLLAFLSGVCLTIRTKKPITEKIH